MSFLIDPYRTPPAKLTSTPYPEIVIERMTVSVSIVKGQIYGWTPIELNYSVSIVSGELREILKSYDVPAEKIDLAVSIVSGELREILKSYDVAAEAIGMSVDIQSGELKVILIQYVNWNEREEQLAMSVSIVSGTLA
jgi:hypothetical protein